MSSSLIDQLGESFSRTKSYLGSFSTELIHFTVLIITGIILAKFSSWATRYLIDLLRPVLSKSKIKESSKNFICNTIYWLILLIFAHWALISLNLGFLDKWLNNLEKFIPQIMVALLIVLTGYVASKVIKAAILQVSSSATIRLASDLIGIFVVAVSIIFGLDQIEINSSLINNLFLIAFTFLFGGVTALLIIASSNVIQQMMSAKFISETYEPGQLISVNNTQGIIKSITSTSIHLQSDDKMIVIPASMLLKQPVTILNDGD